MPEERESKIPDTLLNASTWLGALWNHTTLHKQYPNTFSLRFCLIKFIYYSLSIQIMRNLFYFFFNNFTLFFHIRGILIASHVILFNLFCINSKQRIFIHFNDCPHIRWWIKKKKCNWICYAYRFSHFPNIPNPVLIVFEVNLSAEYKMFSFSHTSVYVHFFSFRSFSVHFNIPKCNLFNSLWMRIKI